MATPHSGQIRGSCGHMMASFDRHDKCARCRETGKGFDPCVLGEDCYICQDFTPEQVAQLSTRVPTGQEKVREKGGQGKVREFENCSLTIFHIP